MNKKKTNIFKYMRPAKSYQQNFFKQIIIYGQGSITREFKIICKQ